MKEAGHKQYQYPKQYEMTKESIKGKGVKMQAAAKVKDANEYAECQRLMSGHVPRTLWSCRWLGFLAPSSLRVVRESPVLP